MSNQQNDELLKRMAALETELAAKARELELEAALERVRARAMAMQNSGELVVLIDMVQKELIKLEFAVNNCIFWIMSDDPPSATWWVGPVHQIGLPDSYEVPFTDLPLFNASFTAWKERKSKWVYVLEGQNKKATDLYIFNHTDLRRFPNEVKEAFEVSEKVFLAFSFYSYGGIHLSTTTKPLREDQLEILSRFSKVFDQTYTRFLDLQKAEVQAREAQIELGLERVRARAMAMQKSGELKELIATVSVELTKLDFTLDRSFIIIYDPQTFGSTWWMSHPESPEPVGLFVKYHQHDPYLEQVNAWREQKLRWEYLLGGEAKKNWDEFLFNETELSLLPQAVKTAMKGLPSVYISASHNNFGSVALATTAPLSNEQFDILLRFAKVFDLTYTRFNDLQRAEAQAREAQIQLALERVRARTMAMQKSEELTDVAAVLFEQVAGLGINAWTTGFNIWSDDNNYYTDYITNPKGGFMEPYTIDATVMPVSIELRNTRMRGEEFYLNYEEGEALAETYRQLQKFGEKQFEGILESGFQFPSHQYEHFVFGSKVSLMFITYEPVPEAHDIFKRFGKVFEQTYTRFLDLQKAEAQAVEAQLNLMQIQTEKKRAEEALAELQQTQRQLIQREKMASLGELTAGIAHEIQNPLNFVNNFSETNAELLEELVQANKTGNTIEVEQLAKDIRENEQKISHHGKRADSIVKNMLQHSRKSTGEKQLTDINALCEEYLRLSYQAMCSKDKSFQALIQTHFDENLRKINVVPQDMGRVLLNLFNNAFYAVNEKRKRHNGNYQPSVFVQTKKHNNKVEIVVGDNGNGIPQNIANKIFQPFFTTKPTGQGTGLGLSLAYDTIKAHSGEIRVEAKEGEGAEFVITIAGNV